MILQHAYVAVRDLHADGGPDTPETWGRSAQGTGWWMLTHPSGDLLAAYLANAVGSRGLFAVFGPQARLEQIAAGNDEVMPGRELWRRRLEPSVTPAVRRWRTWTVDDGAETEVKRTLIDVGDVLPATPPTIVSPWFGTITQLHRPALETTLAGHTLHVTLEDEPDRNPA